MKIPKIKMSRRTRDRVIMYGGMVVYAFGAALYGAVNYLDGSESSWEMLTTKTDLDGNTFWTNAGADDKDARYLMFGKEATKKAYDALSAGKRVGLSVFPADGDGDEQAEDNN